MSDLKPCPFCGGEAELQFEGPISEINAFVRCMTCRAFIMDDWESATEAWNTRTASPVEVGDIGKIVTNDRGEFLVRPDGDYIGLGHHVFNFIQKHQAEIERLGKSVSQHIKTGGVLYAKRVEVQEERDKLQDRAKELEDRLKLINHISNVAVSSSLSPMRREYVRGISIISQKALDGSEDITRSQSENNDHQTDLRVEGERQSPWQPIETAPKDGTKADVLFNRKGRIPDVYWGTWDGCDPEYTGWLNCGTDTPILGPHEPESRITHWMPLPPKPEVE